MLETRWDLLFSLVYLLTELVKLWVDELKSKQTARVRRKFDTNFTVSKLGSSTFKKQVNKYQKYQDNSKSTFNLGTKYSTKNK